MKATRKEDIRLLDKLNKLRKGDAVMLSTHAQDVCNVSRRDALTEARKIADELNQTIIVRNALTDQRYGTVGPCPFLRPCPLLTQSGHERLKIAADRIAIVRARR